MKNPNDLYKAVRVTNEIHKELKQLALDMDMPMTQLIEYLLKFYKNRK